MTGAGAGLKFNATGMKEFLSSHLPAARSLAGIAHELLLETRQAATARVSDLRGQVEELWHLAGDMVPRPDPAALMRHVESTIEGLKKRDLIGFPTPLKA